MRFEQPFYTDPDLFLMADEDLIERSEGAKFHICQMVKESKPVLYPDKLWEGGDGKNSRPVHQDPLFGTVLFDPDAKKYVLWYNTCNRLLYASASGENRRPQGSTVCMATSADGLNWEKPVVGAVNFENSLENNMIRVQVPPILTDHLSGIVPNYVSGATTKLVATMYSHFNDPVYPMGITQMYGDDGINWMPHFPPTLPLDGDAHCLMWDPRRQAYLCTTRSYAHGVEIRRLQQIHGQHQLRNKRHVAIAASSDLVHWTPMIPILEADEKDPSNAQLYYMYVIPYGHGYVGIVQLFYMDEKNMTYGPLDMQLVFARNWTDWKRVGDRLPILPRGPAGSWDQSHVSLCTNPPFPEGNRMRFWFGGKDTEHWQAGNAALGSATLRRDGFACWEAGVEEACLTTVPFEMTWAAMRMFVNIEAPKGELRMSFVDAETEKPLDGTAREDCKPVTGDHLRAPFAFGERRGSFVRHTGKVRLKIHLRNARLYSFICGGLRLPTEKASPQGLWL